MTRDIAVRSGSGSKGQGGSWRQVWVLSGQTADTGEVGRGGVTYESCQGSPPVAQMANGLDDVHTGAALPAAAG